MIMLKHKAQRNIGAVVAVAALLLPLAANATSFTGGLLVPAGTTTNVTSAVTSYFFPTIMATLFQQQVIEILIVIAAVMLCWFVVRAVWKRLKLRH